MVLTKQLVLRLLLFKFMLLLLLGRFARVVNLDTKINGSIIIILLFLFFIIFIFCYYCYCYQCCLHQQQEAGFYMLRIIIATSQHHSTAVGLSLADNCFLYIYLYLLLVMCLVCYSFIVNEAFINRIFVTFFLLTVLKSDQSLDIAIKFHKINHMFSCQLYNVLYLWML